MHAGLAGCNVVAPLRVASHGGMRARGRKTDFNYLHLQLLGRFPRCIKTHVRYNEVDEHFALLPEARACVRASEKAPSCAFLHGTGALHVWFSAGSVQPVRAKDL